MNTDLETYLSEFSPEIRDLTLAARDLVLTRHPDLIESVKLGWGSLLFSKAGGKMKDAVCYVAAHKRDVNLGFQKGSLLPDPEGLLLGTGKYMRHVKLAKPEDLANPALWALLDAAHAMT